MGKRDGFVNPGARFCVPEAAAVRRPRGKPPSLCLTRYRFGGRPMAVTGAFFGRSSCRWAGARDGGAGEGSAEWGRGRPVGTRRAREGSGLGPETAGPAAGLREPSFPSPGSLITLCHSVSGRGLPQVVPLSEPSFHLPGRVGPRGTCLPSSQRTGCRSRALGPSYVTGESLPGRLRGREKRLDSTFWFSGFGLPCSGDVGAGRGGRHCLVLLGT